MEMNGTAAAKQLYMCYAEDFVKDKSISSYKLQIQEMGKRNRQRRGI